MNKIVSHIAMILLSLFTTSNLSGDSFDLPGGQDIELLTCLEGDTGSTSEDGPDDIDHDDDDPPVSLYALNSDINWTSLSLSYGVMRYARGPGMDLPPPEWRV